ncbi:hypothetical protein VULLAG_LOCUS21293 [Vulpes lagopus]
MWPQVRSAPPFAAANDEAFMGSPGTPAEWFTGVVANDVGPRQLGDTSSAPAGEELLKETGGLCGHTVDLALLVPVLGFPGYSIREKQSMPHRAHCIPGQPCGVVEG